MLPLSWTERDAYIGAYEGDRDGTASDSVTVSWNRVSRISHFRKENHDRPLAEKYLHKLVQAQIKPRYEEKGEEDALVTPAAPPSHACATPPPALAASSLEVAALAAEPILEFDWADLPSPLQPSSFMNPARAARKEDQLRNMIRAVGRVLNGMAHVHMHAPDSPHRSSPPPPLPRPIVVDFCCGSGHLGFPIAWLFPECDVYLLEHNRDAISKAHERLEEMRRYHIPKMNNVKILHMGIEDFNQPFDIGVGLHACGWLSDMIQLKCFQWNAGFVLAPCCVGKCKAGEGRSAVSSSPPSSIDTTLTYPRSRVYTAILTRDEYIFLTSKADYSDANWDFTSRASIKHAKYKAAIEWDRSSTHTRHNTIPSSLRSQLHIDFLLC